MRIMTTNTADAEQAGVLERALPPVSALATAKDWKNLWYGAADGGRIGKLRVTSVIAGQEGSFNYRRNSKSIPTHQAVEQLLGAWMCIRVYRGDARDPSTDTAIGCAWLPLSALLSGGSLD